jgi:hypothetical protein
MITSFGDESMARPRRYHPLVANDLAGAVAYYDNISIELGHRFRGSVRDRIDTITDGPTPLAASGPHRKNRAPLV